MEQGGEGAAWPMGFMHRVKVPEVAKHGVMSVHGSSGGNLFVNSCPCLQVESLVAPA